MALRFGTDGLRGVANVELTTHVAFALGRAAARTLAANTFLVGADTRLSSPELKHALAEGLSTEGVDVVDLGVITTPGDAFGSLGASHLRLSFAASRSDLRRGIGVIAEFGRSLEDAVSG